MRRVLRRWKWQKKKSPPVVAARCKQATRPLTVVMRMGPVLAFVRRALKQLSVQEWSVSAVARHDRKL
eukprot:5527164-Pleurochrysis_carterae.AAC.2